MSRGFFIVLLFGGLILPIDMLAETFCRVVDESGSPLAGAHVRLIANGSPQILLTDADGGFQLDIKPDAKVKVTISYIGYTTETFVVNGSGAQSERQFRMTPDIASLEETVVTATRTPKALKDVPVVTRVITEDEIGKIDATNIQDLLTEELPGLEFGFAMSQETSLNMSGFGGNAVLFLIDGERMAGETMDNVDYNRLNLDNIGRVEVVKGASSALYGANAVGGVVNLITKESNDPWRVNLNSRYRSAGNEWRTSADLNFHQGKWNSNTNVQYTTVNRIELTDVFDTQSRIHEIFGGQTVNVKERLQFRASDVVSFIARGSYFSRQSNRANYDDHYTDYSGGLRTVMLFSPSQTLELSYSYDQYDKARFVGGKRTHDHDYSNRQHIAHALYTHSLGAHALTAGADYMNDYLTTYQFVGNRFHSQNSADLFAQFDFNPLKWLNAIGSMRYDYFSASRNGALTGRLALMFKLAPMSIRASYAGGFRAPTLKEMYMNFDMAGIQMIYGNPDLKPEKSHNFNLALEHCGRMNSGFLKGSYTLTLSGYYNLYDRRITTTDFAGTDDREEGAIYCNEDGVRVGGLDFTARYRSAMGIGAMVSYNYMRMGGNKIDSQFSQPRPHSATWRLDFDRQICSSYKLYVGLSGRYLSKPVSRYETDQAYSLWKFTCQQRFWRGINLNFTVDNLLGYRPKVYYWNSAPTSGRTWTIGVSLDIDAIWSPTRNIAYLR